MTAVSDLPVGALSRLLAEAWACLPYDDAERVYKQLRGGVSLDLEQDGDTVAVRFTSGELFCRLRLDDLRVTPPVIEYV